MPKEEYFGTDEQRAVLRRGRKMADLLRNDARYSYYGRTVGLVGPEDGGIDQLAALASVQGNSNYSAVPVKEVVNVTAALEARNLVPVQYAKWEGKETAIRAAKKVIETLVLPKDVTMARMDASTPDQHIASLAHMALRSGVLPMCGEVMRGLLRPAVCLYAHDRSGKVVSCAAASTFAQRDHPTFGGQAWWGMLATDPSRRGERLALILGAHALLDMQSRFEIRDFMTGVEPGNTPSESVCSRMGMAPGAYAIVGCADPMSLTGGRMTK